MQQMQQLPGQLAEPIGVMLQQQLQQQQDHGPPAPNMLPVTRAIAGLPHLEHLELMCSGLSFRTVKPLTALTQLTNLAMAGCNFDDAACCSLVLSLTGLRKLSLRGSELVNDVSLVVISKALPQLTALNIEFCSRITDRGVLQMSGLQQLRLLEADKTYVSLQAVAAVLRHTARVAE
eukprot:jgi/Sobl393_1/7109/SZX75725.1